ncbi:ArsR/SmtB family transcription factor [Lacrimispora amygdalina]|uniref:ArsR/SmtB family transcription factor n=1 Tax=Lacrimispora amygdalina TaxID=253257 RepID=UPI000BE46612|nr:ArsR family transcriptional regulator [Lacrimispora amygdalina]
MSIECTVIKEIDYYIESIELLFRIINKNSYQNLKMDILKRTDETKHEKICYQLDKLSVVQDDIEKYTDLNDPQILYYFSPFLSDNLCIAKILFQCMRHSTFSGSKDEIKSFIVESMESIKNDDSLELSYDDLDLKTSVYENNQKFSFTDRINNLECEPGQKWKLLELIEHSGKHLDNLYEILDQTVAALNKHEETLVELQGAATAYWVDYFEQHNFHKLMNSFYNIKEDSYPSRPTFIRTRIMACNRVIFYGNDENVGDYHLLDVGILFDCNFKVSKRRLSNQELSNGLRLLSDPSKFEILRFIRNDKAYGQEIAAELKLTTATISHHMNTLMKLGLINIEKSDNKVFYQMNKEAVNYLLEVTKSKLLED